MYENITNPLPINDDFKRKIEFICRFACVKYELTPGNIISVKNTNICYIKPHILRVKGNDYLLFENSDIVFINGYNDKIKLTELENYLKKH